MKFSLVLQLAGVVTAATIPASTVSTSTPSTTTTKAATENPAVPACVLACVGELGRSCPKGVKDFECLCQTLAKSAPSCLQMKCPSTPQDNLNKALWFYNSVCVSQVGSGILYSTEITQKSSTLIKPTPKAEDSKKINKRDVVVEVVTAQHIVTKTELAVVRETVSMNKGNIAENNNNEVMMLNEAPVTETASAPEETSAAGEVGWSEPSSISDMAGQSQPTSVSISTTITNTVYAPVPTGEGEGGYDAPQGMYSGVAETKSFPSYETSPVAQASTNLANAVSSGSESLMALLMIGLFALA